MSIHSELRLEPMQEQHQGDYLDVTDFSSENSATFAAEAIEKHKKDQMSALLFGVPKTPAQRQELRVKHFFYETQIKNQNV